MIIIIFWVGLAVAIAYAASERGRSAVGWFLVSLVLSPLMAGLLLLLFPNLRDLVAERSMVDDRELQRAIKRSQRRVDF